MWKPSLFLSSFPSMYLEIQMLPPVHSLESARLHSTNLSKWTSSSHLGITYCNSGIAEARNVTIPSHPGGNSVQKNLGES